MISGLIGPLSLMDAMFLTLFKLWEVPESCISILVLCAVLQVYQLAGFIVSVNNGQDFLLLFFMQCSSSFMVVYFDLLLLGSSKM